MKTHVSDSGASGSDVSAPHNQEGTVHHQSANPSGEGIEFVGAAKQNHDLVHSVKGMYRILDLISEQGSGGLGEARFFVRKRNH